MSVFRPLHGFTRMFQRLFGMLVPGLVIFFPVVHRGSSVGVCGELVEFGSSLVRVIRHDIPLVFFSLKKIPVSALSQKRHKAWTITRENAT